MELFWGSLRMKVRPGRDPAGLDFNDLPTYTRRIRGDHHIFVRDGVAEILNLQPLGSKAKPYQVRQVRKLIEKYRFEEIDEHDV